MNINISEAIVIRSSAMLLKSLIYLGKKMLILEPEECLGGWGLIDCDPVTGDPTQQDMDIILLLSQKAYYVAEYVLIYIYYPVTIPVFVSHTSNCVLMCVCLFSYDDETDQVSSYQRIFLDDIEKMEIGPAPALFKSKYLCIRIWYCQGAESGYFHTFRTTSTRLFNNIVIVIKNEEEAKGIYL